MWLLGLFGLAIMSQRLKSQFDRRYRAEQELQQAKVLLEERVTQQIACFPAG